jgi:Flp pilus assembly protein TadG
MRDINKKSPERGAVIVEFALLLPFLFSILVGTVEFGLLFYNKQVLTNASREGARAGISHLTADVIKTIVVDYSQDRLITFGGAPNVDPNNVKVDPLDPVSAVFPNELTVSITYKYTFIVPKLLGFGTDLTLNTETVMNME